MSAAAGPPEESLIAHLLELRTRLLRAVLAVALAFAAMLPFADRLYSLIAAPLLRSLPKGGQLIAIEVTSTFFVPMKLLAALMLAASALPMWAFVAPHHTSRKTPGPADPDRGHRASHAGCAFTCSSRCRRCSPFSSTAPAGAMMTTSPPPDWSCDAWPVAELRGSSRGDDRRHPRPVTPKQLDWRGYVMCHLPSRVMPADIVVMLACRCLVYEAGLLMARCSKARARRRAAVARGPASPI
jgi:sec-independent protein translocase protein TatC